MDEIMDDFFDDRPFRSVEMDPDYEFDAARYFDFSRPESLTEAQAAELWFEEACTYPPSPYVGKLIMSEDLLGEHLGMLEQSEAEEQTNLCTGHSDLDSSMVDESSGDCDKLKAGSCFNDHENIQNSQQALPSDVMNRFLHDSADVISHAGKDVRTEWKCSSPIYQNTAIVKTTSIVKAPFPRVSTLMKPTASQLAKQTQPQDIKGSSRFKQRLHKPLEHKSEKSMESSSVNESHAVKKQKLEGGYLRKVLGPKQQTTFIHKISKKNGLVCSDQPRLRLTIPREPELETSQRAHRIRPKHSTEVGGHILSALPSFKARPVNGKILTTPSMPFPQKSTPRLPEFREFHLKTSQRAMQHSSAAPSSVQKISNSDEVSHNKQTGVRKYINAKNFKNSEQKGDYIPSQLQKPVVDELQCERNKESHKFKARPLNTKILSSKGDMGVFRSNKRETTVTMEFNFQTEKRLQQNLPIELFNKLSLKSEPQQQDTAAESMLSRYPHTRLKFQGSKENIDSLRQEGKMPIACMEKLHKSAAKQIQNDGEIQDARSRAIMCRSSGIR